MSRPKKGGGATVCKECIEKYQRHLPVNHFPCYYLIQGEGGADVKAPKDKRFEGPESVKKNKTE